MLTISCYVFLADLCIYKVLSACEEIAGLVHAQLLKTIPPPKLHTMHVIYDLDIPMYTFMPPLATNKVDEGDKMAPCLFYNMTYHPKYFLKIWQSYSQRNHKSNQVAVTRKQRYDREKHPLKTESTICFL